MPDAAVALIPPLREGDQLTSPEFLHRWEAMPDLKFAELLDGMVFMPSPVSMGHSDLHASFTSWLWLHSEQTRGVRVGADATWLMGPQAVPQPDLALRILPEYGGQSRTEGQYLAGAPELIVEVSGATTSRDLGIKLDLYRRNGVKEYITVLLKPRQFTWRTLVNGRYEELEADPSGVIRSRVFPGLWLEPAALWTPGKSLRTALDTGLASPEHAAFAQKLQSEKR